jgi:hypothetical protein
LSKIPQLSHQSRLWKNVFLPTLKMKFKHEKLQIQWRFGQVCVLAQWENTETHFFQRLAIAFWPRIGISNQYDTQIITSKPSQFTWHSQYLGVWLLGRGLSLDRCYILLVFLYVSGKFVNGSFS